MRLGAERQDVTEESYQAHFVGQDARFLVVPMVVQPSQALQLQL